MKVVILAGGFGTRLGNLTEFLPKPMIPVGGQPIIFHIMRIYAHYGFKEFVLCLGYKADLVKEYFLNFSMRQSDFTIDIKRSGTPDLIFHERQGLDGLDWKVTLADTGLYSMTGSRIKRASRYFDGDDFLLTYGDGVADISINDLVGFHKAHGKIGTITAVHPPARFGNLDIDGQQVMRFEEKKGPEKSLINGGFYVFRNEFLDYLSEDSSCVLEKGPLEVLAAEGNLSAFHHRGFWQCMDTARDLELLDRMWKEKDAPWKVWNESYTD